jgi:hypothetical protein
MHSTAPPRWSRDPSPLPRGWRWWSYIAVEWCLQQQTMARQGLSRLAPRSLRPLHFGQRRLPQPRANNPRSGSSRSVKGERCGLLPTPPRRGPRCR